MPKLNVHWSKFNPYIHGRMSSWLEAEPSKLLQKPPLPKPEKIPKFPTMVFNPVKYATPKCKDTAVILVLFNPTKSYRIVQNMLYVKHMLDEASIPYFIGEVATPGTIHTFSAKENIFLFSSNSVMFFKENIINVVLNKPAVAAFSKYVILDSDVIFSERAWLDGISKELDICDVLQPYKFVNMLDISFMSTEAKISICSAACVEKEHVSYSHTGYAWAFTRDWWEAHGGLYEYALIGSGDKCLAKQANLRVTIPKQYVGFEKFYTSAVPAKVSFLPYAIWHLYHGSFVNRQYVKRNDLIIAGMAGAKIDVLENAVEKNADGILQWKLPYRHIMNHVLLEYFKGRQDDGLEVHFVSK